MTPRLFVELNWTSWPTTPLFRSLAHTFWFVSLVVWSSLTRWSFGSFFRLEMGGAPVDGWPRTHAAFFHLSTLLPFFLLPNHSHSCRAAHAHSFPTNVRLT